MAGERSRPQTGRVRSGGDLLLLLLLLLLYGRCGGKPSDPANDVPLLLEDCVDVEGGGSTVASWNTSKKSLGDRFETAAQVIDFEDGETAGARSRRG